MSIKVPCPVCGKSLVAPDSAAGKRARCPQCQTTIRLPGNEAALDVTKSVPAAPPLKPVEEDTGGFSLENALDMEREAGAAPLPSYDVDEAAPEEDAESGQQRRPCPMCGEMIAAKALKCRFCGEVFDKTLRRSGAGRAAGGPAGREPGWKTVRSGLNLIFNSIVVVILAALGLGCTGGVIGAMASAGIGVLAIVAGLLMFCSMIAIVVGQAMCAAVPSASGAKGLAIGAACCFVVNLLFNGIGSALGFHAAGALGGFVLLAGHILFVLFLWKAASYLGNQSLARSAIGFLIFGVCAFIGFVILGIVAGVSAVSFQPGGATGILILIGLGAIVGGLIGFIWYLKLIRGLRNTIDEVAR